MYFLIILAIQNNNHKSLTNKIQILPVIQRTQRREIFTFNPEKKQMEF